MGQQLGISKLDLKRQNRMQILNTLKKKGQLSRIDIATLLKLTRAAVTIITNEMIEQGVLMEVGEMQYSAGKVPKGRKKILIDINRNYRLVFGVIIDEHQINIGLSTLGGEALNKRAIPHESSLSFLGVIDFITASYCSMLTDNCLKPENILGLGIGVVPSMYTKMNISLNEFGIPNFSTFYDEVRRRIPLPVVIENSIYTLALANIDFAVNLHFPLEGHGNLDNVVFLQYNSHFNLICVNLDESINSYRNSTRLIERMIVNIDGEKLIGYPNGSVRAEISSPGLLSKLRQLYGREKTPMLYKLTNGDYNKISLKLAGEAAHGGDTAILKLQAQIIKLLAVLVNNIICAYNPQKVIFQNFFETPEEFNDFKRYLSSISAQDLLPLIETSPIDRPSSFLGGCALAMREFFFKRGGYEIIPDNSKV